MGHAESGVIGERFSRDGSKQLEGSLRSDWHSRILGLGPDTRKESYHIEPSYLECSCLPFPTSL